MHGKGFVVSELHSKHEFALFYENMPKSSEHQLTFTDRDVVHRIRDVLRLHVGDTFVLFNQNVHAQMRVIALDKKSVGCEITAHTSNPRFTPRIVFGLPLLKKDDFDDALAHLGQLGINDIQLIATQKAQRSWGGQKEYERAQRILQATAEQSKHYAYPHIHAPIALELFVQQHTSSCYAFVVDGKPLHTIINSLAAHDHTATLALIVGPEGDFTSQERAVMADAAAQTVALTPTVLRSVQAATLAAGIVRSLLF
jgi:16S rRNA (uracil1498-N3)-methyltransferase